jgi:hypothetical protein
MKKLIVRTVVMAVAVIAITVTTTGCWQQTANAKPSVSDLEETGEVIAIDVETTDTDPIPVPAKFVYLFSGEGKCLMSSKSKDNVVFRRPNDLRWVDMNGASHQVFMVGGTFAYVSDTAIQTRKPVIEVDVNDG